MNKQETIEYFNKKFSEIPKELFPKIKEIFDRDITAKSNLYNIKTLIEKQGLNEWAYPYHFTVGMAIRNDLRNNGITDDLFPDQNLDDYYVPMLEWWAGYRTLPLTESE
jgi:hypothetical protein